MAEEHQDNPANDFQDASDNSSFDTEENSFNSAGKEIHPENAGNTNDEKNHYSHPNIIINVPENIDTGALEEARKANKYTRIGIIINSFLLILTLGALGFTWWSISLAKHALDDSRKEAALNRIHTMQRDSIDSIQKRIDFSRDTANLNLSKESLQAQINSIKETQKDFSIQNEPYLELSIKNIHFEVGKPLKIEYAIANLGNYPVQIFDSRDITTKRFVQPDFNTVYTTKGQNETLYNKYIIKESPAIFTYIGLDNPIFNGDSIDIFAGKRFIYYWGYIRYKNLITNNRKEYDFMIRYDAKIGLGNIIKNKNINIGK